MPMARNRPSGGLVIVQDVRPAHHGHGQMLRPGAPAPDTEFGSGAQRLASISIKCLIGCVMETPPTTRKPAPTSADRRHALVEAAFNQIAERGFEGLRTREVAAEVGVNIATLHYYFPTKEALIRGVVELSMQRFRSTLTPHGSSADQLRNHLRAVRRLLGDEPQLGAVMGELALRSARDPVIAGIMEETNGAWHRTVRGLLRRAARDGHLRAELDSDD